jgi:hypothetical protein
MHPSSPRSVGMAVHQASIAVAYVDRCWQAPGRLGTRARPWRARGTHVPRVGVALARALRACLWAMAHPRAVTPSRPRRHGAGRRCPIVMTGPGKRRRPGVVYPAAA